MPDLLPLHRVADRRDRDRPVGKGRHLMKGDQAEIIAAFAGLPALLDADAALVARGCRLNVACLLGPKDHPFHVSFAAGRIVEMAPAPILMRSWCFSYRASPAARAEFWKTAPRAG